MQSCTSKREGADLHRAKTASTHTCAMGNISESPKAFSLDPSGKQEQARIIKLAKEQTSESSQSCKIGQGRNQVMITACSSSLPKFR